MGRNGAGKSTLLRHAAGLMRPTRGKVRSSGRVALLLQNPTDYLVHERVAQEASPAALATVGLGDGAFADRHPRDLSGGEKQRLALAIVLDAGGDPDYQAAAVVCLDEPTRGMDRRRKDELAALLRELDAAVLVATHDPEFVAAFARTGRAARRRRRDRRRLAARRSSPAARTSPPRPRGSSAAPAARSTPSRGSRSCRRRSRREPR